MARKKKEETLVHIDLEKMSKPVHTAKESTPVSDEQEPETLGKILQQTRQRKKIKLSDVSQKLCIKEIYLDSLEKGNYYAFPGLAYGVGFLRTYSAFLGLDPSEMIDRFYQETSGIKKEPMEMPQAENTNALPGKSGVVKSLLVLLVFYAIYHVFGLLWNAEKIDILPDQYMMDSIKSEIQDNSIDQLNETESIITSNQGNLEKLVQNQEKPSSKEELTSIQKNKTKKNDAQSVVVKEQKTMLDSSISPKTVDSNKDLKTSHSEREAAVYGLKKQARISFVADDKVWIEVRDVESDRVLLSKVLEKGDRYNPIEDADGLEMKVANAGAISVYIDGKFVKKLGNQGIIKSHISMNLKDFKK